jgi:hypothetical protein
MLAWQKFDHRTDQTVHLVPLQPLLLRCLAHAEVREAFCSHQEPFSPPFESLRKLRCRPVRSYEFWPQAPEGILYVVHVNALVRERCVRRLHLLELKTTGSTKVAFVTKIRTNHQHSYAQRCHRNDCKVAAFSCTALWSRHALSNTKNRFMLTYSGCHESGLSSVLSAWGC